MERIKKIYKYIIYKIGYDVIGSSFKRYLCVYSCYMIASLLSTTFFNVFLLKALESTDALAWYNLLLACFQPVIMVLAIPVLRHISVNACLQTGLMLHAAAYLWLALTANVTTGTVYIISCIFSAGNAFFFTSYTPQILAYTDDKTRDTAFGSMGFLSTVASLTLPIVTGFFISILGNLTGYRIMFAASSAVLTVGILLSLKLKKVNADKNVPMKQTWFVFRRMLQNRDMLVMLIITMLTSVEVSGKAYYSSVLVYELLQKESVIGTVTAVGGLVGLLANLVYGKFANFKNRGKVMVYGALFTLLATLFLNVFKTSYGYVIYFIVYSFATFFISTPVVTEYMGVLQKDEKLKNYGAEVHACREFFYASGRVLGLLPAFFIPASVNSASAILIFTVILQLVSGVMMVRIKK